MDLSSRTLAGYAAASRGVNLDRLSGYARAMVDNVVKAAGVPLDRIISGHRDADHNAAVGGAKYSQHILGNAVDIDISGMDDNQKRAVLEAAVAAGARGIGIYPGGNSLHIDVRQTPALWGLAPGAPYSGMSPENAPAWAKPALTALFGRQGGGSVSGDNPIASYINEAASRFGVSAAYLQATARRESSWNPNAKNPNSTAAGLFQFTDDTWQKLMANYGEKLGLKGASPYDPRAATLMAALLAKENKMIVGSLVGREISDGETYLAHFMGARGAVQMIRAYEAKPDAVAATLFPAEAAVNEKVFFGKDGKPRTVAEVYADLTKMQAGDEGLDPIVAAPLEAPKQEKVAEAGPAFTPVKADIRPVTQEIRGPQGGEETSLDRLQRSVAGRGRGLLG